MESESAYPENQSKMDAQPNKKAPYKLEIPTVSYCRWDPGYLLYEEEAYLKRIGSLARVELKNHIPLKERKPIR